MASWSREDIYHPPSHPQTSYTTAIGLRNKVRLVFCMETWSRHKPFSQTFTFILWVQMTLKNYIFTDIRTFTTRGDSWHHGLRQHEGRGHQAVCNDFKETLCMDEKSTGIMLPGRNFFIASCHLFLFQVLFRKGRDIKPKICYSSMKISL